MIFVNRRRIKQNSGIVKDPTKYWYIEKYVYGALKETVEVPLGTGTTFGTMDSGYSDDTFYGWSIDSTSTTRKFTATTTYKNTTTAVKNNLDSENTLKIYAIYKYTETTWSVSNSKVYTDGELEGALELEVYEDANAIFGGYVITPGSATDPTTYESLTFGSSGNSIPGATIDGVPVTGTVNTHNGSTTITKAVVAGQIIKMLGGIATVSGVNKIHRIECTVPHWVESKSTKYRVTRN